MDEWDNEIKKRLSNLPSNLNITVLANQFGFIYNVFKSTFGPAFFNVEQAGSPIKEQNWLHQLLVNIDHKSSTILLVIRDYTGDNPIVAIKVFCKPQFNDVKVIMERLTVNY